MLAIKFPFFCIDTFFPVSTVLIIEKSTSFIFYFIIFLYIYTESPYECFTQKMQRSTMKQPTQKLLLFILVVYIILGVNLSQKTFLLLEHHMKDLIQFNDLNALLQCFITHIYILTVIFVFFYICFNIFDNNICC